MPASAMNADPDEPSLNDYMELLRPLIEAEELEVLIDDNHELAQADPAVLGSLVMALTWE
ncbi:hypothetical protein [Leptolyngbya sp. FACHB-261]|uniref:hypothetical protein n=1 Tax=Leptolyngbya sp. FACHB-261 TaxID=2692806 RepID=UPI0016875189|nr:hypothetical protein [Leptolyngbya sp. FACHB-261]MBD2103330.1 hypothetical protein [Leptolyngbya sp. FACHB-261]